MLKNIVSLAIVAVALLTSSMAFASSDPVGDKAFLASLQAPQAPPLASADRTPAPLPKACTFACQSCSTGAGVQLCTTCNGVKTCGSCSLHCQF